ncbi:hypothetical protein C4569_03870 [Candidatus Parcubacteria bacterium]|nr:MAG: hypothetical protein C4569_03870 [Candidatus Parcubacteria bacterium]
MKETRKKSFQNVIMNKENLKTIFEYVKSQYMDSLSNKDNELYLTFSIQINCIDGSSYETTTDDIFNTGDILDLKKCESVYFHFSNLKAYKKIDISIIQNNSEQNRFIVVGADRNWVSGTFNRLNEIFESFPRHESVLFKYKNGFFYLATISFSLLYIPIFFLILSGASLNPNDVIIFTAENKQMIYTGAFLILLMILVLGFSTASMIFEPFYRRYFPSIEFDFGPEYTKLEKRRRKLLKIVISSLILPIVIDLILAFIVKR